ncbi:MAG TPA: carboxypeptidase regulatory-like domain-containing protein [Gemmatimonadaceae bacterium]|jgi:hypothetical protein
MRARSIVELSVLLALPISAAWSQTGTFAGSVTRDTLGTAVAQAEVQLPQLNRTTATNAKGEFQFSNIPAGRYAVSVRAIGFLMFVDSVDIAPGGRLDADLLLTPTPVTLAPQHTTAAVVKRLPPGLQEMDDRMKTHLGGYFVTDSSLRANDERKLTYFLARLPALHQVYDPKGSSAVYMANALKPGARPCYVDIFMDGVPYYIGARAAPGESPPDFNDLTAFNFSGVEYYPTAAGAPAEYNGTGSGCGVMLLWTRHTP